jgi:hypothetical protein
LSIRPLYMSLHPLYMSIHRCTHTNITSSTLSTCLSTPSLHVHT